MDAAGKGVNMIRPAIKLIGDMAGFPIEVQDATGTATWVMVGHANKIDDNSYFLHFLSHQYGEDGYYHLWNGAFVPISVTRQAAP